MWSNQTWYMFNFSALHFHPLEVKLNVSFVVIHVSFAFLPQLDSSFHIQWSSYLYWKVLSITQLIWNELSNYSSSLEVYMYFVCCCRL